MYQDTITLFNYHASDDKYYPTVLHNVDLNIDRAAIVAKYDINSKDNARLHIKHNLGRIGSKRYILPKEYEASQNPSETLTFGTERDFFIEGEYSETPVSDNSYTDGFYSYINANYDNCFKITSAAKYSVIPHFEIMGA